MNKIVKRTAKSIVFAGDLFIAVLVIPAAIILKALRTIGIRHFPFSKRVLLAIGVFPIRNHYYEPLFDCRQLTRSLSKPRNLPGVNWNVDGQLELLSKLSFHEELWNVPRDPAGELKFFWGNKNFGPGDAEYWYGIIRYFKPKRIIEVGCGYSTLMAEKAIARNRADADSERCKHICIEPYEMQWLEQTGVEVVRSRVEEVDRSLFQTLGENDILFVDSSHVIRPQGDVLFEFLEILPELRPGVIVQVHDIFTPRDYLEEWVCKLIRLYDEQYLLEAFLTFNDRYKVIGALNFLHHSHYSELRSKCPFLSPECEPGSFYIQRTR